MRKREIVFHFLTISILLTCIYLSNLYATTITFSHTFVDGEVLTASLLETMKTDITAVVNAGGGPVGLTNSQTVSGTKTFSGANTHSGSNTFSGGNTHSGANTFSGTNTFSGAVTFNNTIDASAATFSTATPVQFEGATNNDFETSFAITDPTADRTITIPNESLTLGITNSTVVEATRDMTAASGDVSYTGCGFTPASVLVIWGIDDSLNGGGVGFAENSGAFQGINISGTVQFKNNTFIYIIGTNEANSQEATMATYDSDGFTLTWTKNGSPTGTANLVFYCQR